MAKFVCQCIKEVSCTTIKCFPRAITFPKGDDLLKVLQGYEESWGFPMCAGAIDGTHIPILAPADSHVEYVNRKLKVSIASSCKPSPIAII